MDCRNISLRVSCALYFLLMIVIAEWLNYAVCQVVIELSLSSVWNISSCGLLMFTLVILPGVYYLCNETWSVSRLIIFNLSLLGPLLLLMNIFGSYFGTIDYSELC